jgi:hypothetical protein
MLFCLHSRIILRNTSLLFETNWHDDRANAATIGEALAMVEAWLGIQTTACEPVLTASNRPSELR